MAGFAEFVRCNDFWEPSEIETVSLETSDASVSDLTTTYEPAARIEHRAFMLISPLLYSAS